MIMVCFLTFAHNLKFIFNHRYNFQTLENSKLKGSYTARRSGHRTIALPSDLDLTNFSLIKGFYSVEDFRKLQTQDSVSITSPINDEVWVVEKNTFFDTSA
jgi:hypothetical protein